MTEIYCEYNSFSCPEKKEEVKINCKKKAKRALKSIPKVRELSFFC